MKIYFPNIKLDNKNIKDFLLPPLSPNEMKNYKKHKSQSLLNNGNGNEIIIPGQKKSIAHYLVNLECKNIIYSESGIFEMNDNKMNEILYKDGVVINDFININNNDKITKLEVILDKSNIIIGDEVYQIPIKYILEQKIIKTYQLRDKSENKLIVELINNEIKDFYIETKEKQLIHTLMEDIISFLMVLNLYK